MAKRTEAEYKAHQKYMNTRRKTIAEFPEYVNESTLSRVRQHMLEHDTAIISAEFQGRDVRFKNNIKKNKQLRLQLNRMGYGVTHVRGHFLETSKKIDSETGKPKKKLVKENFYVVVDLYDDDVLKRDVIKLGEKFDQDSVMFIPKMAKQALIIGTTHREDAFPEYHKTQKLKSLVFGKDDTFKTIIWGKPIVFNEATKTYRHAVGFWPSFMMRKACKDDWRDTELDEDDYEDF